MSVLRPNNVIEKANMGHETAWRQILKDNEIKTCIYLMYTDTFVSYVVSKLSFLPQTFSMLE